MIFRIKSTKHPLSNERQFCAGLMVGPGLSGKFYPLCYGWGNDWPEAVKDLVRRSRQVRNSSRNVKKKELMDTQKIPAFISQHTTPLDPHIKAQLEAEMQKTRDLIHESRRVGAAAKSLGIDTNTLENSQRMATNSLLQLAPKDV